MGLYKQPSSVYWWCEFVVAKERYRLSTETTDRKAAKAEERRLRAEIESKTPARRRGVGTLENLGAEDVARSQLEEGSVDTWITRLTSIWVLLGSYFGTTDPIKIDLSAVRGYIAHRRAKGIKGQTLRRELQALLRGLKIAKAKGWIKELPDPWPVIKDDPKDKAKAGKLHAATTVAKVVANLPPMAIDGVRFCAATGLRLFELCRVRPEYVHLLPGPKGGIVALLTMPKDTTKGRKERTLGLNADALEIIARRKDCGFVDLTFPPTGQSGEPYGYGQALRRTCQRIGVAPTVTMRDLRHAYASNALKRSGGNLSAVSKALGHSETETTTLYLHAEENDVTALGGIIPIPPSPYPDTDLQQSRARGRFGKRKMVEPIGIEPTTSGLQSLKNLNIVEETRLVPGENVQEIRLESKRNTHTKSPYKSLDDLDEGGILTLEPLSLAEIVQGLPWADQVSKPAPVPKAAPAEYPRVTVACDCCFRSADVEQGPGIWECIFCGGPARVEV